jgi:predicted RND superfamily exporter protein
MASYAPVIGFLAVVCFAVVIAFVLMLAVAFLIYRFQRRTKRGEIKEAHFWKWFTTIEKKHPSALYPILVILASYGLFGVYVMYSVKNYVGILTSGILVAIGLFFIFYIQFSKR